ncbi:adhesive plaque matrix protein 2-like [Acanthaster planci]|uniref:Adhesive plaque matrix protein 2-like n=1 Tax=Acanthaster planci TaxID=133434 RepID=A0A8B8A215_ACAPL|nr:adhesive plaque matrix protein 2-like [Acanthaster planci]
MVSTFILMLIGCNFLVARASVPQCTPNPCVNAGVCYTCRAGTDPTDVMYRCECPAEYSGEFCETRISADCPPTPACSDDCLRRDENGCDICICF